MKCICGHKRSSHERAMGSCLVNINPLEKIRVLCKCKEFEVEEK